MKNTTKRLLAAAAAVMMLASLSACSDKDSSDSSAAASATDSAAAENTESKDEASSQDAKDKEIEELTKQIELLSARVDDLEKKTAEFEFGEDYHEVYDDTAVVEAYKKKDASALTDKKDKYIYESLVKAVDEIIKDGMSEYEKEKAVYDYIFYGRSFNNDQLNPVDMDEEGEEGDNSHNPYGFFHDHSTICVGNATTFKLFMDVLGIECEIIHSTENGEHAWNLVKIDGDWYHVDITFDGGDQNPVYSNFNVTDAVKEGGGYPWDPSDFHECTATKYNYVMMNAKKVEDVYSLPKLISKAIKDKESALYLTFDVPEDTEAVFYSSQITDIMNMLSSERYYFSISDPMISKDEKQITLSIGINDNEAEPEYPDEWPDDVVPDDYKPSIDYSKMQKAFDKEFDGEITLPDEEPDYYNYGPNSFQYEGGADIAEEE